MLESDLLVRLALCLDPKSEATKGISEKALRSLGIDAGELAPKEREHRENRRLKLKAELIPSAPGERTPATIPGLVQKPGMAAEYVVPIPWAGLSIIAEKIARGCEYKLRSKKFIEPPYAVRTRVSGLDIDSQFLSHRTVIDFGPGCQVIRIFAADDENVVKYRILIWGTLCLHVFLDHEDYFRSGYDPKMEPIEGLSAENRKAMRIPPYLREFK